MFWYFPFNVEVNFIIFKLPYIAAQLSGAFLSAVLEGVLVVSESSFEGVGGKANVGFVRFVVIIAGYCGLVYHRFVEALAAEWTFVGFSAVAFVIFWFIRFQLLSTQSNPACSIQVNNAQKSRRPTCSTSPWAATMALNVVNSSVRSCHTS